MADNNQEDQIPMLAISELKGKTFVIPSQQRGYKWTSTNVRELIDDLRAFIEAGDKKPMYCLQPLAVVARTANEFTVLDGQQRLTTLFLLYKYLTGKNLYTLVYDRDDDDEPDLNRHEFLQNIDLKTENDAERCIDFCFIRKAFETLREIKDGEKEAFINLMEAPAYGKTVKFIWYEVAEEKSHETFRNLNSGKMELSNTELIKALFLNRVSGLVGEASNEAASLFEIMEQQLREDNFWYMFNTEDVKSRQNRLDCVFNLVSDCKKSDYETDPRWSFRNFFDIGKGKGTLEEKWKQVRHTYLRLRDLYEDPLTYHYIGFLTYCGAEGCSARALLKEMRQTDRDHFIAALEKKIAVILKGSNRGSVDDYNYDSGPKALRQFFVLYNITTILSRFETLKKEKGLKYEFERFPFDLLHSQNWDIEHIASRRDAKFDSREERDIWLESVKSDLGKEYEAIGCGEEEKKYNKDFKKEDFLVLYKKIIAYWDKKSGHDAIPDPDPEADPQNEGVRKDKNQIGNLTILDSHTNRSYRNALFPRKRRVILAADGLKDMHDNAEKKIKRVYIPPATHQCFTKAYKRGNDVKLNLWGQSDAEAYTEDIKNKLDKFFRIDTK